MYYKTKRKNMAKRNDTIENTADREIVITRLLNAPRELVFEAWTDPKHLINWWGPKGFTNTFKKADIRTGGEWVFIMHGPDGIDYPNRVFFEEIVRPERIVYTHGSDDINDPAQFRVTATFEKQGAKTNLTMQLVFQTAAARDQVIREFGAIEGANQTMDRLESLLADFPGTPYVIERTYNAPVAKVWKAITNKDDMKKWYFDLPEFRAEVGFEFQFTGGKDENNQYLHLCKITEVVPEKKLTYSWRYDGYAGISYVTFELSGEGNQTKLKLTHEGLETFPASNEDLSKRNFATGWSEIIGTSLKTFVEK
jgi:uncharacterized protein YndB with AHSA1/START domain